MSYRMGMRHTGSRINEFGRGSDGRLVEIRGRPLARVGNQAGHWLMLEAPEKFNALLLDYLKQEFPQEARHK